MAMTRQKNSARAVFLDKDGTLVENVPYNVDPARVRLCAGAGEALRRIQGLGYRLFVVTNQSGVARRLFPESALPPLFFHIRQLLAIEQVRIDGFYFCPHHVDGTMPEYAFACNCRKPLPGMLLEAAREHGIDLPSSWMIGDILHDIECGRRAGCRTILIDNGNETEWESALLRNPHFIAPDLPAGASLICANSELRQALPAMSSS